MKDMGIIASLGELQEHASKTCLELLKGQHCHKRDESNPGGGEKKFWEKGMRDEAQTKLSTYDRVVCESWA